MDNRELDARVAREFFEWSKTEDDWWIDGDGNFQEFVAEFHPSYDPKANALVLDEMERRGWYWQWFYDWDRYVFIIFDRPTVKVREIARSSICDNRYQAVCEAVLHVDLETALQAGEGEE